MKSQSTIYDALRWRFPAIAVMVVLGTLACRRESDDASHAKESAPHAQTTKNDPMPTVPAARPDHVDPAAGCVTSGCHADMHKHEYIHGPVAINNCEACHGEQQPGHKFPLKRKGNQLCTLCHVVPSGKPFVHQAVVQAGCTHCHNPHGSSAKYLLTKASVQQVCRDCHPETKTGKYRHGPYDAGACTTCHLPHEADNPKLTILSGPQHCYRCHTEIKKHVESATTPHPPVVANCLNCHEQHVADVPKMLKMEAAQQCRSCHAAVDEIVRTATAKHGAVFVGKQCGNCHDVHGSSQPALLKGKVLDVCLSCHEQPQTAYDGRTIPEMRSRLTQAKNLHGPIEHGECQACHRVHGSSNSRLLSKYFPGEFYKDFDLTNYALCFGCHEQALVMEKQTTTLTDFRNGDSNLHFLHVNRLEKGRSCKACHEIHGSDQPKHMADSVPFEGGGWSLPIRFEKTDTGGGCAPGCHKPYRYNRAKPVNYPAGAE